MGAVHGAEPHLMRGVGVQARGGLIQEDESGITE